MKRTFTDWKARMTPEEEEVLNRWMGTIYSDNELISFEHLALTLCDYAYLKNLNWMQYQEMLKRLIT